MTEPLRQLCGTWKHLRTKTDETADDTDWVGTNAVPDAADRASLPRFFPDGRPVTGIEFFVAATTAVGLLVARATGTVEWQFVEVVSRDDPNAGGTGGLAQAVIDTGIPVSTALCRKVYVATNGAELFTIRITTDANVPATTTQWMVYWREVSR